jgi:cell division protein FtsB
LVENGKSVDKRKKNRQVGRGYRGKKEQGVVSPRQSKRNSKQKRRLHIVKEGRGEAVCEIEGSRQEPRTKRGISKEARRRRRLTVAVLSLLAAGLIVYILLGPVTRTINSRNSLSRIKAELADERSQTQALEERKIRALTEEFVEEEARKMGYVKPGEIPIIVLDEGEAEKNSDTNPDNAPSP